VASVDTLLPIAVAKSIVFLDQYQIYGTLFSVFFKKKRRRRRSEVMLMATGQSP
jgi:hypothetical protein